MDLRPIATKPTDLEREAVDAFLDGLLGPVAPEEAGSHDAEIAPREAKRRRHLLLPSLHSVQDRFGWVSPGALGYVCERLHVPPAEAFGVATFYALFSMRARPPVIAHVCDDIACKLRGSDRLIDNLRKRVGPEGKPSPDGMSTWLPSPCLGLCERAPAALLVVAGTEPHERGFGDATVDAIRTALSTKTAPTPSAQLLPQRDLPPVTGKPHPSAAMRLLRRVGVCDPSSLDDYRAHGGYRALRAALDASPADVIREVADAGLVGRGGAAFPTARKWEAVAKSTRRPKWLIANADESEPGTFKDRVLMEGDPFALVEAMTIAGYATGCERGMIYVRAEYPLARERLERAIAAARTHGLLGDDVLGRGVSFDIEVRRGAGAYICGEETALLNSIEGFRGEPRTKPPFPVEHGLYGQPTVINNVETLVNVIDIVNDGSVAWRALGTQGSPGTRLFCLSGSIQRPGLYEVPCGMRLDELLAQAGGAPSGRRLRAVLLGGAASAFLAPNELSVPLTLEDTRKINASLGSGVVLCVDDAAPLLPLLARIASFFRDESCGQCVPCRVGTVRQEELLTRLVRRSPHGSMEKERALFADLAQVMRDASICGLGQTAPLALESAFAKLGDAIEEEAR